jgi:hypothetical protein
MGSTGMPLHAPINLSLSEPSPASAADGRESDSRNVWVQSAAFDSCCFLLSPLAGLVLLLGDRWLPPRESTLLILSAFYFIGIPHYLSTLTFYLGDDNLREYGTRPLAFFAGPLLILAAVTGLWWGLHWHPLIKAGLYTWNIYHVSKQSAGILNIYRLLNGGPRTERAVALLAILSSTAAMALWPVHGHPSLVLLLAKVHPQLLFAMDRLCLVIATVSCALLAWRISRRATRISLPEFGFLLTSVSLGVPYILVDNLMLATLAMLMGHFIQYLALVWLLHRRKYSAMHGSSRQRLLGLISRRPLLLCACLVGCGALFWLGARTSTSEAAKNLYACLLISANFVHFYLDGLIWAFRRSTVRDSIAPYLMDKRGVA